MVITHTAYLDSDNTQGSLFCHTTPGTCSVLVSLSAPPSSFFSSSSTPPLSLVFSEPSLSKHLYFFSFVNKKRIFSLLFEPAVSTFELTSFQRLSFATSQNFFFFLFFPSLLSPFFPSVSFFQYFHLFFFSNEKTSGRQKLQRQCILTSERAHMALIFLIVKVIKYCLINK